MRGSLACGACVVVVCLAGCNSEDRAEETAQRAEEAAQRVEEAVQYAEEKAPSCRDTEEVEPSARDSGELLQQRDVPAGWCKDGFGSEHNSRDVIRREVDAGYLGRNLRADVFSFHKGAGALTGYRAFTRSPAAARLAIRHFRTAYAGYAIHSVSLGDGGWSVVHPAPGYVISVVVWWSGRHVLVLRLHSFFTKSPVLTQAQLLALARKVQQRT